MNGCWLSSSLYTIAVTCIRWLIADFESSIEELSKNPIIGLRPMHGWDCPWLILDITPCWPIKPCWPLTHPVCTVSYKLSVIGVIGAMESVSQQITKHETVLYLIYQQALAGHSIDWTLPIVCMLTGVCWYVTDSAVRRATWAFKWSVSRNDRSSYRLRY